MRKERDFCQTLLKDVCVIKPRQPLIGSAGPSEFIIGAWETLCCFFPSTSTTRKDTWKGLWMLCVSASVYLPQRRKLWINANQTHHSLCSSFNSCFHNSASHQGGLSHQLTLKLALMLKPCRHSPIPPLPEPAVCGPVRTQSSSSAPSYCVQTTNRTP